MGALFAANVSDSGSSAARFRDSKRRNKLRWIIICLLVMSKTDCWLGLGLLNLRSWVIDLRRTMRSPTWGAAEASRALIIKPFSSAISSLFQNLYKSSLGVRKEWYRCLITSVKVYCCWKSSTLRLNCMSGIGFEENSTWPTGIHQQAPCSGDCKGRFSFSGLLGHHHRWKWEEFLRN